MLQPLLGYNCYTVTVANTPLLIMFAHNHEVDYNDNDNDGNDDELSCDSACLRELVSIS